GRSADRPGRRHEQARRGQEVSRRTREVSRVPAAAAGGEVTSATTAEAAREVRREWRRRRSHPRPRRLDRWREEFAGMGRSLAENLADGGRRDVTMTEESLFELALNAPEAQRPALLDRECKGDDVLRARVQALLSAHGRPADWLASPHDPTGP